MPRTSSRPAIKPPRLAPGVKVWLEIRGRYAKQIRVAEGT